MNCEGLDGRVTHFDTDKLMHTVLRLRDVECAHHLERTKRLMQRLLDWLAGVGCLDSQCRPLDCSYIVRAAIYHDLGKIAIPDSILLKPTRLSADERRIMAAHTWLGAQMARQLAAGEDPRYISHLTDICTSHHENWDGSGYPVGLKENDIPYSARLMHIVDVYDALVSQRPYKEAFTHMEAVAIMKAGRGTHFDPAILDVFIAHLPHK